MMHKYIKKLPNDIIQHIISYTYNFQSKILLNDIISYIETRKTIYYNYFNLYIDLNEYKYLLINDLISYVKEIYEDEKKIHMIIIYMMNLTTNICMIIIFLLDYINYIC